MTQRASATLYPNGALIVSAGPDSTKLYLDPPAGDGWKAWPRESLARAGKWLTDQGWTLTGTMWASLGSDGTVAMNVAREEPSLLDRLCVMLRDVLARIRRPRPPR